MCTLLSDNTCYRKCQRFTATATHAHTRARARTHTYRSALVEIKNIGLYIYIYIKEQQYYPWKKLSCTRALWAPYDRMTNRTLNSAQNFKEKADLRKWILRWHLKPTSIFTDGGRRTSRASGVDRMSSLLSVGSDSDLGGHFRLWRPNCGLFVVIFLTNICFEPFWKRSTHG